MEITENVKFQLEQLQNKYNAIGQKTEKHLEGLIYTRPIVYWDYVHTDTLLSLQIPRTGFPDEMVFIMYHQMNELIFKMILWEIEQLCSAQILVRKFFIERLQRISRYFNLLTDSFEIMEKGMDVDQYMKFRNALTPASGFQSAQYRLIEFTSTDIVNLIDNNFRSTFGKEISFDIALEHLYWQSAGKDFNTKEKSYFLDEFEKKYKPLFKQYLEEYGQRNIWRKFIGLTDKDQNDSELVEMMKHYDYTVNVKWVKQHLKTAVKYIDGSGVGDGKSTGGSDWKKYMDPQHQKRIFFPELWTQKELSTWGQD